MDTGEGRFVPVEGDDDSERAKSLRELKRKYTNYGGVFRVGEIVEIKGSRFKVNKISPKKLILRVLPKD
jgi:hypothetical protein